jgi:hypothetical protein
VGRGGGREAEGKSKKETNLDVVINPFIFIRNKRRVMSSEGFSALE